MKHLDAGNHACKKIVKYYAFAIYSRIVLITIFAIAIIKIDYFSIKIALISYILSIES